MMIGQLGWEKIDFIGAWKHLAAMLHPATSSRKSSARFKLLGNDTSRTMHCLKTSM